MISAPLMFHKCPSVSMNLKGESVMCFFFFSLLSVFGYKLTRVLICLLLQARSADTQAEPAERKTPQFIV